MATLRGSAVLALADCDITLQLNRKTKPQKMLDRIALHLPNSASRIKVERLASGSSRLIVTLRFSLTTAALMPHYQDFFCTIFHQEDHHDNTP
ncbi:hypothetical protein [Ferrimonas senticii]|uniref:hypothetical protein n=1 Tax=Ferrimonas senticii TaxID=394566 RepID=UPI0003F98F92|nr:hypothetical protein [Ferrimonas senticii]